ncbi:acylglycerol kinase, mitochondrial [Anabrus simplex]|uniref:acylglycerol kinase, mitochondrial n=1 Tax=Anabrus simplex TaxID=316456 RepID=UPI0035A30916
MSKIVKLVQTLRNNWKKSVFGAVALTYGVNYGINKYNTEQLMIAYCQEAVKFGHEPAGPRLRHVLVILNPTANRRKAKKNFEKFCAPLLHLAGISVDIIQTEFEGQARSLAEKVEDSVDGVIVAGGDGTLSETITGMLRKAELGGGRRIPVGVLPLGRTNTVANSLFGNSESNEVKMMAEAAMAVVKELTKPLDVMKIEVLETEDDKPGKPVFSLGSIEWGAYRDAHARRDKYWYWDGLRSYVSYIFTGLKGEDSGICWQCKADLAYSMPCAGCSKCYNALQERVPKESKTTRWWQAFIRRPQQIDARDLNIMKVDYTKVVNDSCGDIHEEEISCVDLSLNTANVQPNCRKEGVPHIEICMGPPTVGYFEFVSEGWKREKRKEPTVVKKIQAQELKLVPKMGEKKPEGGERWISIDSEDYEVKPIHVKLLPRKVDVFCRPENL